MEALEITLGFVTATAFCLALIPFLVKLSATYSLYDLPDHGVKAVIGQIPRKVHTAPIPRLGGIAIFISFALTNLIWTFDSPLKIPILASAAIFAVGLIDDLYPLPAKLRLFIQSTCALLTVHFCHLDLHELALTPDMYFALPPAVGELLGAFVIVGAINSINMIDGLDGLAGGVVVIGISLLGFLHFLRTHDAHLLLYATIPMIGAILGFLRYNTYPAKIFMGDSGSNWLGFMTGILLLIEVSNQSIHLDAETGRLVLGRAEMLVGAQHVPIISAVLCLAIPVFDTAYVMISRFCEGLSPMTPDKRHFHHTLLSLGLSHSQSVSAVYFLAFASGILGLIPVLFTQYNFSWLPYLVASALFVIISMRVRGGRLAFERLAARSLALKMHPEIRQRVDTWIRMWERVNRYVLYLLLVVSPAFAGSTKSQVGYAAAVMALFIVLVTAIRRDKGASDFFDSIAISMGAVVLLVSNNLNVMMIEISGQRFSIQGIYNDLFIFLFVSTALLFVATIKKRYFVFTPSDFLLAAIPMILLLVPEPYKSRYHVDVISIRSLVIFLSLRTMVRQRHQYLYRIRFVTVLALIFVALCRIYQMRLVY